MLGAVDRTNFKPPGTLRVLKWAPSPGLAMDPGPLGEASSPATALTPPLEVRPWEADAPSGP